MAMIDDIELWIAQSAIELQKNRSSSIQGTVQLQDDTEYYYEIRKR